MVSVHNKGVGSNLMWVGHGCVKWVKQLLIYDWIHMTVAEYVVHIAMGIDTHVRLLIMNGRGFTNRTLMIC